MVKVLSRRIEEAQIAVELEELDPMDALRSDDPPAQVTGPSGVLYHGTACFLRPGSGLRRIAILTVESC